MCNLLIMSVTAIISPEKGYSVQAVGAALMTQSNTVQSITLKSGTGTGSPSFTFGPYIEAVVGTVTTSPETTDKYVINAPLVYVVNNSNVIVIINGYSIPKGATVLFVRKLDGTYGLLSTVTTSVTGTITSVI